MRGFVAPAKAVEFGEHAIEAASKLRRVAAEEADRVLQIFDFVAVGLLRLALRLTLFAGPGPGRGDPAHHVSHEASATLT